MLDSPLRILVREEEGALVAQCLEHDICVQAPDMETLQHRFEATLIAEEANGGLDHIPPAPAEFHALWDGGEETASLVDNSDTRLAA